MAAYRGYTSGNVAAAGGSAKVLGRLLAQLQLPARDLGRGQLVVSRQLRQRLALGEGSQRHLGFELDRVADSGCVLGS